MQHGSTHFSNAPPICLDKSALDSRNRDTVTSERTCFPACRSVVARDCQFPRIFRRSASSPHVRRARDHHASCDFIGDRKRSRTSRREARSGLMLRRRIADQRIRFTIRFVSVERRGERSRSSRRRRDDARENIYFSLGRC